jgi:hypothetical protein
MRAESYSFIWQPKVLMCSLRDTVSQLNSMAGGKIQRQAGISASQRKKA